MPNCRISIDITTEFITEILNLEDAITTKDISEEIITKLVHKYAQLIEHYDLKKDPIKIYFLNKMQHMLSKPATLTSLTRQQQLKKPTHRHNYSLPVLKFSHQASVQAIEIGNQQIKDLQEDYIQQEQDQKKIVMNDILNQGQKIRDKLQQRLQKSLFHHAHQLNHDYSSVQTSKDTSRAHSPDHSVDHISEISPKLKPVRYLFESINQKPDQNNIIEAAKLNKMAILNQSVDSEKNLHLLKDDDNRTILHYLALNNNTFIFNRIISKYKEQAKEWLQVTDVYHCQAAHYFVFKGKLEILKMIEQYYTPENLMGFAAYGNNLEIMIYLYKRDKGFHEDDFPDGVTSLHMACAGPSYYAALLLMKWEANVNCQDQYNLTPLKICAKKGQPKLIRKLFHRGAKQQKFTKEEVFDDATWDALNSFRYSWHSIFCQLNIKPRKKSWSQVILFLIFFCLMNIPTIIFEQDNIEEWINYVYYSICCSNLIVYIILLVQCPGYVNKKSNLELEELIQQYQLYEICIECATYLQPRAKHCEFCRQCIIKYDHHCPWANNCIGKNNLAIFIIFIYLLFTTFIFVVVINIYSIYYIITQQTLQHYILDLIIPILICILSIGFLIPLFNLIVTQMINITHNLTTYERLILQKPKTEKRKSIIEKIAKTS